MRVTADLTMRWIDDASLNTLVRTPGVGTLSTVSSGAFPSQKLQFAGSYAVRFAGFGFDVSTTLAPSPLPPSVLDLGAALGGMGLMRRRRAKRWRGVRAFACNA